MAPRALLLAGRATEEVRAAPKVVIRPAAAGKEARAVAVRHREREDRRARLEVVLRRGRVNQALAKAVLHPAKENQALAEADLRPARGKQAPRAGSN